MYIHIYVYTQRETHTHIYTHHYIVILSPGSMTITFLISVLWRKIKISYQSFLKPELTKKHPPPPLYKVDSAFSYSIV